MSMKKKACIVDIKKIRKKYLRQPSIDFDFCNILSSCDVVCKGCWHKLVTDLFCDFVSILLVWVAKLENNSNLITSPSSYQCRKTRLVHFVIHGQQTSMECVCAYWGSPKVNLQNKWKKNT
jgi:hypothetical protein